MAVPSARSTNPDIPIFYVLCVWESLSRIYTTYDDGHSGIFQCMTKAGVITKTCFFSYYDEAIPLAMNMHLDEEDTEALKER